MQLYFKSLLEGENLKPLETYSVDGKFEVMYTTNSITFSGVNYKHTFLVYAIERNGLAIRNHKVVAGFENRVVAERYIGKIIKTLRASKITDFENFSNLVMAKFWEVHNL